MGGIFQPIHTALCQDSCFFSDFYVVTQETQSTSEYVEYKEKPFRVRTYNHEHFISNGINILHARRQSKNNVGTYGSDVAIVAYKISELFRALQGFSVLHEMERRGDIGNEICRNIFFSCRCFFICRQECYCEKETFHIISNLRSGWLRPEHWSYNWGYLRQLSHRIIVSLYCFSVEYAFCICHL